MNADTAVEVGGVKVTQGDLDRAYSWLLRHGCTQVREGYAPRLDRLKPYEGAVISWPEEYIWLLYDGQLSYKGFASAFIDPPSEQLRTRAQIVTQCRLPRIALQGSEQPNEAAAAWASRYDGAGTPWLWILGGNELERTKALTDIAFPVAHAMDSGAVHRGGILYCRTFDLCETVNSSNRFGGETERTKWNALREPMCCDLLLLDGFGRERTGAHELETISQLIGARWRNELPTAIASNAGLAQWVEAHDRAGHTGAREVMAHILSAMGGYASDQPSREALSASLIDLTANRRKAQP